MRGKLSPCLFICELSFFVPVKILGSLYRVIFFKACPIYLMDLFLFNFKFILSSFTSLVT